MNYQRLVVFKVSFLISIAIALFSSPSIYGTLTVQAGSENGLTETNYVNISSPVPNQNVTAGNLTIVGASSDNSTSDCTVYVGWNDSRPFQRANPNGSMGVEDYSTWNFTFDPSYHEIVNGTNLISSELSCFGFSAQNATFHSLNITGVVGANGSNVTDAGYFYTEDSSFGLSDTGSLERSVAGDLVYDNTSEDYSFDGYSTDYDNDSTGSDDSTDDSSGGEDTGTGENGGTYPLIDDGVFNIGAAGDWASGSNAGETALNMHRKGVDLTLGLGDYAYSAGSSAVNEWWNKQMAPLHDRFKGALGNHDTQDQSVYAQLFGQSDKWFYSFDKEGVHFIAINSEEEFGPGSSQYNFIDQDLQSASTRSDVNWIIVFFHQPMYTSPSHHDPVSSLRNAYHPLFDKYDVDLVLQGHNHNYQRSFPIAYNSKDPSQPIVTSNDNAVYNDPPGQIYAEVGTGGKESYSLDGRSSFISRQLTTSGGFLDVAFPNGQTMKGTFYDNADSVKDEFTIQKSGSNIAQTSNDVASTEEDTPVAIQVLTNDKNEFGLPAIQSSMPNPNLEVQIALEGSGPLHGTAHVNNNNNNNKNNKVITYTPSPDYFGPDSFTYSISQANSQGPKSPPSKVIVNVNPVNDPPQANNDNATSDGGSEGVLINVLANDIDPDGDSLQVIETSGESGSSALNDSSIVNKGDGTIVYTPPESFSGVDSFSYTISDGSNATASATVQITVNPTNDPPLSSNTNVTTIVNATESPPIKNDNGSDIQHDPYVGSNTSETGRDGTITNNNNSINSSTFNDLNATEFTLAATENLEASNMKEPSGLLFQNGSVSPNDSRNASASVAVNADNYKSQYDYDSRIKIIEKNAEQIAREAASQAEQALDNKVNSSFASAVASSEYVSGNNDSPTETSSNGEQASDSAQSIALPAEQLSSDLNTEADASEMQTKNELILQVEIEMSKAEQTLENKYGNTNTEIESPTDRKLDNKRLPDRLGTLEISGQSDREGGSANDEGDHKKVEIKNNRITEPSADDTHKEKGKQNTQSQEEISSARTDNSNPDQNKKTKPKADAGNKQITMEQTTVTLDGTKSKNEDGNKLSYSWKQIQGPKVRLLHYEDAVTSFESPSVPSGRDELTLKFVLSIIDDSNDFGGNSDKDTVVVIVKQDDDPRDNRINDEKTRKSADEKLRSSVADDKVDQDRAEPSKDVDNEKKSDGNNNANREEPKEPEEKVSESGHAVDQKSSESNEGGDDGGSNDGDINKDSNDSAPDNNNDAS